MKKQVLVILSIVAVAAGIFCIRNAKAGCANGMCGRTQKPAQASKPQAKSVVRTVRRAVPKAKPAQTSKPTSGCKNGMCSRRK